MKYILVCNTFKRQLKKFRRHFTLEDVLADIKEFIRLGGKKGETHLGKQVIEDIPLHIAKLRLKVYSVHARYLIGITDNGREYIPIIIDLKTGKHGKNLGLKNEDETKKAVVSALRGVVEDYKFHTKDNPRMVIYQVDL